jgi:hypothetical protein
MTDDRPSTRTNDRLWGLAAAGVAVVVGIIVGQFEPVAMAEAAGGSAGIIFFLASIFWDDRTRTWFWIFMGSVTVVHGVALCAIPWPVHHKMNKGDILFGVVDALLMLALGALVNHLARKAGRAPANAERAEA